MRDAFCKHCKRIISWTEKKRSYAKSLKLGISKELAKELSPMHIKCVKLHLKTLKNDNL